MPADPDPAAPVPTSAAALDAAVLFVDDEPNVLSGLRRMLRGKNGRWRMAFAGGGDEALRMMEESKFDAIVTDMRMPRMDGVELLSLVEHRHPETIRIVLSGQCDQEGALRSVGPSHMFLAKPCEAEVLVATVERALSLRRMIFDPAVRTALSGLRALPSLPGSFHAIRKAVENPNCSAHEIAVAVEQDPAVAATLLHVANSAYFAPKRQVTSIAQAVQYLGLDIVRAVVLSSGVVSQLSAQIADTRRIEGVWEHSLRVAGAARAAVHALRDDADPRLEAEAYTAGLLHDIGRLALAAAFPGGDPRLEGMDCATESACALAERAVYGVDHGVMGGFLMGIWGLPDGIVEAIAYHHDPAACYDPAAALPRAVCLASAADDFAQGGAEEADLPALCVKEGDIGATDAADAHVLAALRLAWRAVKM